MNAQSFMQRVDSGDDCWMWTSFIDRDGYGRTGDGMAHREAYTLFRGPIPDGMEIDHLCRVRACVNPDHLEVVTHAENVRRGAAARDTCKQGHPYTESTTRYYRGARVCRVCVREAQRRARLRAVAS